MSDFKINSIATKQGQHGRVIAGVSTVNSTGCMKIPSGSTDFVVVLEEEEYLQWVRLQSRWKMSLILLNITSTGNATDFGDESMNGFSMVHVHQQQEEYFARK